MIVRFGYVSMSVIVENASPSKTMTATHFQKIPDREAAIRKLERIAEQNLHNTLRLLKHNRAHDIHMYRFSSKLIPLLTHDILRTWDPFPTLKPAFKAVGDYVKEHKMRVSFHPDHFTVFSTPREEVLKNSIYDLEQHVNMLEAMELDARAKCNIHIGGTYGNKEESLQRFLKQFGALPTRIKQRMTLENDDKTFTSRETLTACEACNVPMVLDIHHHWVNDGGDDMTALWPSIVQTWKEEEIPPKIHVSSPKNEKNPRSHADFVEVTFLLAFLRAIAPSTERLDVMIEAKKKDEALFKLMSDLEGMEGVETLDQSTIRIG
ncbi:UV DNA damage repair endonuclease UvsE [Longirhabdus pacifica]|uniref:UV DNA damage repair endonuclease UvsE n=1 Tax=Longirhabdus pacifica TaxID=2305227 RepID=UPI001008BE70|nr:UV DNA damage repair endonuclease UvsE [Longirhabdus pacifica]